MLLSEILLRMAVPAKDITSGMTPIIFGVTLVFYALFLTVMGHKSRIVQCMTAIYGADIVFTALLIVTYALVGAMLNQETALILIYIVSYWSVPVQGFILAKTTEKPFAYGFVIAVAAQFLTRSVYFALVREI
jgi:hypothetical protein